MSPVVPSMADRDGKIWMDGQLVDWRDAKIHVLTHTLHYGCGAFEGVRAYKSEQGTAIFRLEDHTKRLFNRRQDPAHADPVHQEVVNQARSRSCAANQLESCYLRPLTWIGDRKLGVSPQGQHHPPDGCSLGLGRLPGRRRHAARHPREDLQLHAPHVNITMSQAKAVSNYTNSILASPRRWTTAMTRPSCWTPRASSPKARARTSSSSRTALVYTPDLSAGAAQRHHAQHRDAHLQGPGPGSGAKAHHARRAVHRR